MRLVKIDGSCAIFALSHVSGHSEADVIEVCKNHAFEWGQGMMDDQWIGASKELGIRRREIKFEPCQLRYFLKEHNSGLYLVCTRNHIFAVINGGIIVRPGLNHPSQKAIIQRAWRIQRKTP